uniref:Uncharacterized protein n=1 Tax=uncultured Bacillota bacterium TaxID=344338 RepID=A0A650EN23_9FIRM|nr:hypothetical protein Firmicute1046_0920 [uncultured Firmicutes bacterium]
MIFHKKRLFLVLAVCVIVAAVILRVWLSGGITVGSTAVQVDIEPGTSYQTLAYDKNVLLMSGEGVRAFNTAGQEVWKIQTANTNPFIDVAGKYLLIGEMAGKSFSVYSGNKELRTCKPENTLISAKLNKNGYVVMLCEEAGYKGLAVVQNPRGNEIFKWHSGEGYVVDAALSDDNRYLAVAQIMTNKEKVYSRMIFFDIEKNEQVAAEEREDCIIAKVQFSNGGWVTVSDTEFLGFTKTGKLKYEVGFQGRTVSAFQIDNPNNMVFAFINNQNNTVLEMYDKNGKLRGSYAASGELKNLSVEGEVILCSQLRSVMYIDPAGRMRKSESISHDMKSIQLFSDRKHAFVMGGNTADILKIR